MRILVTGSSGFIGYHLVKNLILLGHEVVGIDDHNDHYDPKLKITRKNLLCSDSFTFYQTSIHNLDNIHHEFDVAINLAAQPGVRVQKNREHLYKATNIEGFKIFCNYCKKKNIKKVIYASSSSVYSDEQNLEFNENTSRLIPKSVYGESKLHNEEYAQSIHAKNNMNMIGLRFFSVYGPWGRPDMAYYLFTENLKNKTPITLFNNGFMYRDMTYIDDIIDGVISSIDYLVEKKDSSSHEIFNFGNNKPISTKELLDEIIKNLNVNKNISVTNMNSINESFYTHASIEKAQRILGYNPKVNFKTGIVKFLEWHDNYTE